MKSLSPYIITAIILLIAVSIIIWPTNKQLSRDTYTGNKVETKIEPQKLPEINSETREKIIIANILETIKPANIFSDIKNSIVDDTDEKTISEPQNQETLLLSSVGAKESDQFGRVSSPFGGSTLSQQCGGGPGPIAGIGPTYAGVVWAYDVCSTNPPEIEPSHPFPACVSANYTCKPPCFCALTTFSVNERDLMYPINTGGASAVYKMRKTKCTCAPVACNVICSPKAWTWDSATNTCVCS